MLTWQLMVLAVFLVLAGVFVCIGRSGPIWKQLASMLAGATAGFLGAEALIDLLAGLNILGRMNDRTNVFRSLLPPLVGAASGIATGWLQHHGRPRRNVRGSLPQGK